jgi:hypothetical protein
LPAHRGTLASEHAAALDVLPTAQTTLARAVGQDGPSAGHHEVMPAPTPSRSPGRALRTVAVADDLNELRGPLTGRHRLPHHLDASARHLYDFADEQWRELAYRTVLMEAGSQTDLTEWLDKDALLALWPQLYLPPFVRQAWERRHPELAPAGARPHVPQ